VSWRNNPMSPESSPRRRRNRWRSAQSDPPVLARSGTAGSPASSDRRHRAKNCSKPAWSARRSTMVRVSGCSSLGERIRAGGALGQSHDDDGHGAESYRGEGVVCSSTIMRSTSGGSSRMRGSRCCPARSRSESKPSTASRTWPRYAARMRPSTSTSGKRVRHPDRMRRRGRDRRIVLQPRLLCAGARADELAGVARPRRPERVGQSTLPQPHSGSPAGVPRRGGAGRPPEEQSPARTGAASTNERSKGGGACA
jgi:hypothetical protein